MPLWNKLFRSRKPEQGIEGSGAFRIWSELQELFAERDRRRDPTSPRGISQVLDLSFWKGLFGRLTAGQSAGQLIISPTPGELRNLILTSPPVEILITHEPRAKDWQGKAAELALWCALQERQYMDEHACGCGGKWQRSGGGVGFPIAYSDCTCTRCGFRRMFEFRFVRSLSPTWRIPADRQREGT
ncbi:MAG: hypothetical protein Q8N47_13880 [Bryobacterales bacterium]|nr:hypothetical protein [Bryobacterales bacterium]